MVLDYCLHALAVWKSKDIPVTFEHNCWHIDDTQPLPGAMSKEQLSWLDFGWLEESGWRMRENDDGQLELTTLVDNFDMGRWLDYLGIDHADLGESFGLFPGEEIEFDEEPIKDRQDD